MRTDLSLNSNTATATATSSQPELLVSAVLHLMSHYTVQSGQTNGEGACIKLASVIERHLKVLSDLPELAPVLRATCQQLSEQWEILIHHNLSRQNPAKRFGWLHPKNA